ncbi:hypothetical protein DPMN_006365 [Dreissena polymorpha]|uniref:Uncharacterized protein n=1 Tax=Dreissena polymorpha TaxID=45954 RepID=A0A9D4MTV9_DREPO|nr:hypothetical protein DPMN_006365 [Dreissena polymorpha]
MDVGNMQNFDVSGLMLALTERHSEMPAMSKSAIPVVVPDPDTKPTTYDNFNNEESSSLKTGLNAISWKTGLYASSWETGLYASSWKTGLYASS